jgi:hypothetical protein
MSNLMSMYFGPLDKGSCVYFLIISVIFFILLVIALFADLIWLTKNFSKLNFKIVSGTIIMLFNIFLAYFVNRLLYTMCSKSLI